MWFLDMLMRHLDMIMRHWNMPLRHLDTDKDDIENNVYTDWDSDSPVILHLSLLWLIGLIFYKIFS